MVKVSSMLILKKVMQKQKQLSHARHVLYSTSFSFITCLRHSCHLMMINTHIEKASHRFFVIPIAESVKRAVCNLNLPQPPTKRLYCHGVHNLPSCGIAHASEDFAGLVCNGRSIQPSIACPRSTGQLLLLTFPLRWDGNTGSNECVHIGYFAVLQYEYHSLVMSLSYHGLC